MQSAVRYSHLITGLQPKLPLSKCSLVTDTCNKDRVDNAKRRTCEGVCVSARVSARLSVCVRA